ncbi:MAG: endonuclease III [Acidobacteriota bacterium]|nr:endonuclease III [Acidobacteriota bacterium]
MRKAKPAKKTEARKKSDIRLSKGGQWPWKSRRIGNKECVLGTDPRRIRAVLGGLDEAYTDAACELKHKSPFQLLISTILSAQCTDVRVNQVTETLYKKYPKPEAFAYATPQELEQEIRPTGFFRNKTKSVMGASKAIVEEFGGEVPRTMEEILTLPGVARKTANVVLGTAYGIAKGVVVDTHVMRLSRRLDLSRKTEPVKIEQDLMAVIPQNKWIQFSHQLIWHGRRVCVARKPRCVDCNLEKICYSVDKTMSTHPDSPCLAEEYLQGH